MNERSIYLARHGQIQSGEARRFIGQLDLPLSEVGVQQAHNLGRVFSQVPLSLIVSSDLDRCRQTAEIIGHYTALYPQARADLREISLGTWEGLTFADVRQRFPQEYEQRGRDLVDYCPPGGENFRQCSQRAVTALQELLNVTTDPLLIVGHAGVNRAIMCHVLGLPLANLFRLGQDYGCFNLIRAGEAGYQLVILNWVPTSLMS